VYPDWSRLTGYDLIIFSSTNDTNSPTPYSIESSYAYFYFTLNITLQYYSDVINFVTKTLNIPPGVWPDVVQTVIDNYNLANPNYKLFFLLLFYIDIFC